MSLRARSLGLLFACLSLASTAAVIDGCSSDSSNPALGDAATAADGPGTKIDGATEGDAGPTNDSGGDSAADGAVDSGANGKGETCIGFAKGTPCGVNGFGDYGYVCFNGSPPGIEGCKLASSTGSFGDTYCCTENKCVAQPDQDKECKTAGKPHRFQCPPNGDAGPVAAPAGCAAAGGGGSAVENFYCCP
ncbi:hypothetical protein BH11MYX4_BH11MYX4_14970 [soil metagenome]